MPQESVVLGAGWIVSLTNFGLDFKTFVFSVCIPVLCGVFVVWVGFKTRAPGPTIVACILAGVVGGLSANMDLLEAKTGETITQYNNGTVPIPGVPGGEQ